MGLKSSATVPVVIDACPPTLERSRMQAAGCKLVDRPYSGVTHYAVGV
jgi:hypothetical protein